MPAYNYKCEECEHVQEERHMMAESPDISCNECGGKCSKTLEGVKIMCWVRGYGLANDRAGAKRDMHLHHLTQKDPYAIHRQPGEVDDMANKLRRGGKHQKNTKTFVGSTKKKPKATKKK